MIPLHQQQLQAKQKASMYVCVCAFKQQQWLCLWEAPDTWQHTENPTYLIAIFLQGCSWTVSSCCWLPSGASNTLSC